MSLTSAIIIVLALIGRVPCRAQITQDALAPAIEGEKMNLSCSHSSITTNENVIWYRQFPNQGPRFIVTGYSGEFNSTDPAGILHVPKDRKSNVFTLAKVTQADAAVYYCALRDTVRQHGDATVQ
uniref:Ig-like domain-containing protein n=1 Tax=Sphenodon punctatus TaxID=8508 RepID=A0A8D0GP28_SPHPU